MFSIVIGALSPLVLFHGAFLEHPWSASRATLGCGL